MGYQTLKYKWLYSCMAVVFCLLIFQDTIRTFLFFNTTSADLLNEGGRIKNNLLLNSLSLEVGLFHLGFYTSFIMPIVSIIVLFDYKLNRHCYAKHFIGKASSYVKQLTKIKNRLSFIGIMYICK